MVGWVPILPRQEKKDTFGWARDRLDLVAFCRLITASVIVVGGLAPV